MQMQMQMQHMNVYLGDQRGVHDQVRPLLTEGRAQGVQWPIEVGPLLPRAGTALVRTI